MKSFPLLSSLLAVAASAQTAILPPDARADEPLNLEAVVVTGSPFARAQDEVVAPTTVLAGARLDRKRQPSLGETLDGEPGISSTYFGPNASRPVIRGLGGDRVRILTGGVGTLDASIVSPDHAVSLDPLLVDRIEVVRGPATLLYGGAAIGGVVNVLDGRIPEEKPAQLLAGRIEARAVTAGAEQAGAGVLTGGAGPIAWRLDGFRRETEDLTIPGFAETDALRAEEPDEEHAYGRLPNSASTARGASFGLSLLGEAGHVGLARSGFDTVYGIPGHGAEHGEGVKIDLRQRRWDLHAESLRLAGLLRAAKLQVGFADYTHAELEDGEVGTRFTNRGYEGRLELLHEPIGSLEGAVGLQASRSDFAAIGDEAFLPPSVTENQAVFVYEEIARGRWNWQAGARLERQEIVPEADSGHAERRHTGASLSAGVVWSASDTYAVALSLTRNERLPNAQELFADGPHAGTGVYEIGDPGLEPESSHGLDLSLRRRRGFVTGAASLFLNDFSGYVFEQDTGTVDPDDSLPVYQFVQRDARFYGGELEAVLHLHETKRHQADLRLTGDWVRAENRTDRQSLPRTTPVRLGAGFDWRGPRYTLSAEVRRVDRATRLAPGETPTDGYTLVNLGGTWTVTMGRARAELFALLTNAGDQTARNHGSFLKDLAPLPGRRATFGVRCFF
ncbi:MAG: TonB-dependent receptor [Opitutaceae bacterium]|nr:TonB-dependent receptor [Opitutaceae bacterium]